MKKYLKSMLCLCLVAIFTIGSCLSVSAASVRTTAPEAGNKYYYESSYNPYYPLLAETCVWYAYGRVYEMTGKAPRLTLGTPAQWWETNKISGSYQYGATPAVGAVVCYSDHVAVVEKIESGKAIVSEGNYSGAFKYGRVATQAINQTLLGYIYCGSVPSGAETGGSTGGTTSVTFTTPDKANNAASYSVGAKNAVIVMSAKLTNATAGTVTAHLYNSSGSLITAKVLDTKIAAGAKSADLLCNIWTDMGVTLNPCTIYLFKFSIEMGGQTYSSAAHQFVTTSATSLTGLSFSPNQVTVALADSTRLRCVCVPASAVGNIEYKTSDPNVATVDSYGVVRGVSLGSCVITATDRDTGHSASCAVTVSNTSSSSSSSAETISTIIAILKIVFKYVIKFFNLMVRLITNLM